MAIEQGATIPQALEAFKRSARSSIADQAAGLWLEAHRTGADWLLERYQAGGATKSAARSALCAASDEQERQPKEFEAAVSVADWA